MINNFLSEIQEKRVCCADCTDGSLYVSSYKDYLKSSGIESFKQGISLARDIKKNKRIVECPTCNGYGWYVLML